MSKKHLIIILALLILLIVSWLFFASFSSQQSSNKNTNNVKICPGKYKVINDPCPPKCENDSDCAGYCGNDECLSPVCRKSDYDPTSSDKYCQCLGLCGVR